MKVLTALLLLSFIALSCEKTDKENYCQGYVEGEFINIAARGEGVIENIFVSKGQFVKAGELLFIQENILEKTEVDIAVSRLEGANAQLLDAKKGARSPERAVIEARLRDAEAAQKLAADNLIRAEAQFEQSVITKARLDDVKTIKLRSDAATESINRELEVSSLAARSDQISMLESNVQGAKAQLAKAETLFEQKKVYSPTDALVYEEIYHKGEWIARGTPILRLFSEDSIKIRFFISQSLAETLKIGSAAVAYTSESSCDCTINYISSKAEYTPPLIFSLNTNHKLVYMAECKPQDQNMFRLGQPIKIKL